MAPNLSAPARDGNATEPVASPAACDSEGVTVLEAVQSGRHSRGRAPITN